jgi:hypothetical protein
LPGGLFFRDLFVLVTQGALVRGCLDRFDLREPGVLELVGEIAVVTSPPHKSLLGDADSAEDLFIVATPFRELYSNGSTFRGELLRLSFFSWHTVI